MSTPMVDAMVCTEYWVRNARKPIMYNIEDIIKDDVSLGNNFQHISCFLARNHWYILTSNFVLFPVYTSFWKGDTKYTIQRDNEKKKKKGI